MMHAMVTCGIIHLKGVETSSSSQNLAEISKLKREGV